MRLQNTNRSFGFSSNDASTAVRVLIKHYGITHEAGAKIIKCAPTYFASMLNRVMEKKDYSSAQKDLLAGDGYTSGVYKTVHFFKPKDMQAFSVFFGKKAGHEAGYATIGAMIHAAQQLPEADAQRWAHTDYPSQEQEIINQEQIANLRIYKRAGQCLLNRARNETGMSASKLTNNHSALVAYLNEQSTNMSDTKKLEVLRDLATILAPHFDQESMTLPQMLELAKKRYPDQFPEGEMTTPSRGGKVR